MPFEAQAATAPADCLAQNNHHITHTDSHTPGISAGKQAIAASPGDPHNRHFSAAVVKGQNEGWNFCSQRKHDYKHFSRFNSSFPPEVRSSPRCLSYSVQHRLPEIPLGIWSYGLQIRTELRTSRNSSNHSNDFKVYKFMKKTLYEMRMKEHGTGLEVMLYLTAKQMS